MPQNMASKPQKPFQEQFRERLFNRATPAGLIVTNAAGTKATVRIYDEIGWFGITAEAVAAALEEITAEEIEVQINSLGGDVFDGIAIYNALRAHPARITTRVDSMAASIASVIAQAGDHRVMLTGSQMMIHEAWGFAIGRASEMRELADILDKQSRIIAAIYAERSDGDLDHFMELMVAETWFDADETVEAGLADEVVKPSRQDKPTDRAPHKFAALAASVVTEVERLAAETEKVVTFRTGQGKPPLSEDAVAILDRLVAATDKINGVVTPEPVVPSNTETTPPEKPSDLDTRLALLRARSAERRALLTQEKDKLEALAK